MDFDATGLEILPPEDCLELLRSRSLGRIGICADALPVVLPVNYVVVDDEIVIRARQGTKLAAATRHHVVAFEVDEIDPVTGGGWSVVVQGVARELPGRPELPEDREATLGRWFDPTQNHHVSVSMDLVSGRRLAAFGAGPVPVAAPAGAAADRATI